MRYSESWSGVAGHHRGTAKTQLKNIRRERATWRMTNYYYSPIANPQNNSMSLPPRRSLKFA